MISLKNKGLQRMRIKEKLKKGVKYILPLECFSIPSALLSGLYESTAYISINDYGFPLHWLTSYPQRVPGKCFLTHYRLNPQNLLLDILFWSAVYGLPILGYKMLKRLEK